MYRVAFFLIISALFRCSHSDYPCKNYVDITDGKRSGSDIIKDGVTYKQKDYFSIGSSVKGCICNVRECVRKCCEHGQTMDMQLKKCVSSFKPLRNFTYFHIIVVPENEICDDVESKVVLDRDFTVLDGVLVWEDITFALEDYCLTMEDDQYYAIACLEAESSDTRYLYSIGMIISTPFLLITFVVYFLLPERNVHRRALMSYVFTLLVAYITLVIIQLYPGQFPEVTCHVLGHLVIFFFLVSFFWMNVMCIDMWLAFSGMRTVLSKQTAERKRFLIYCLYAWGVPTVHTLIVFLINTYGDPDASYYPGIGKRRCYLGEELPTFYYFYLPMAILIGINIVLFIATTVRIQRIKRETSMLKHSESKRHSYEDDKQKFNLYLKLMFAMGVNWTMELVSWAVDWKVKETPTFIWYLTDFTNAMYGLLIFMIFVFKKKIWKSLQKRYYVFVGKPHLAHTMTQSSGLATRTSNYSTTETNLNSDYRLNQLRGDRPEESGLTAA